MPTHCPIALTAGCAKCPIFKVCPLKGVIGDQRAAAAPAKAAEPAASHRPGKPGAGKSKSKPRRGGGRRGRR